MKKVKKKKINDVMDSIDFIETDFRKYVGVEIDVTMYKRDLTNKVLGELMKHDVTDAIVQVSIKIKESQVGELDLQKINGCLESAFYVRPINPEIIRERNLRNASINLDTSPIKAVELFIADIEPEDAMDIYELAKEIIEGAE
jgi:hypothetical protein